MCGTKSVYFPLVPIWPTFSHASFADAGKVADADELHQADIGAMTSARNASGSAKCPPAPVAPTRTPHCQISGSGAAELSTPPNVNSECSVQLANVLRPPSGATAIPAPIAPYHDLVTVPRSGSKVPHSRSLMPDNAEHIERMFECRIRPVDNSGTLAATRRETSIARSLGYAPWRPEGAAEEMLSGELVGEICACQRTRLEGQRQ